MITLIYRERSKTPIDMYNQELPKNIKKNVCHEDVNDHHFTKSFEMDEVYDYDLESLDIKYEIKES